MKRPPDVRALVGAAQADLLDRVRSEYSTLGEYLVATVYEDGEPRETATLTIFLGQGVLTGCLKDRATGRIGWASADSLLSLLDTLETHLRENTLDWRADRNGSAGKGRR